MKHSLIDEKVIQYYLKDYGLSPFSEVRFLTRGLNDTYIIYTDENIYIFRIYRHGWRDKRAIMFELDALCHLRQNDFSASFPIRRQDNQLLCDINAPEGIRYGVLFSYSEGERPQINVDNAKVFGTSLGKLHNVTASFEPASKRGFSLDVDYLIEKQKALIVQPLHTYLGKKAVDSFTEITDHLQEELADKELETGFCHGDFHNHNMHILDGEIEVFDFDCCGMGFRAYDVAVSWWNLLHNYQNQEVECWDSFLKGYLSQRTLSDDDMKSLPLFITARRIWLMGTMLQNDDVWGTNWMTKETFEIFMLQLKSDTLRGRVAREDTK